MGNQSAVFVTQPSLAPLNEFVTLLEEVWHSGILTHNGPLVQKYESELVKKLNIPNFVAVTNGTIAIQMAIKALGLKGEIITTPFTWVATLSAIQWEGCTPVFCDIDPNTLNIDATKIEALITSDTVAILPVHVFGNPCDGESISTVANRFGLKVIYDAAHAIGSTYGGESILDWGDISATSLHATKLINCGEGGGCITSNTHLYDRLSRMRYFGHGIVPDVVDAGFNGKMTEVHAALGLANLKYFDDVLSDRKRKYRIYLESLSEIPGIRFQGTFAEDARSNFSYFPIILESEQLLDRVVFELEKNNIFARRYFYPSVNSFEKLVAYSSCPVSESISTRILCLPLYLGLSDTDLFRVVDVVKSVSGKAD